MILGKGTVALVAHDAGGAEVVSSYARRNSLYGVVAVEGPAVPIFGRKLPGWPRVDLESAVRGSDWVLCGTSWQSDLGLRATRLARAAGKPVVAFLDHWVCYRERFVQNGEIVLPDELWVADVHAEALARLDLPSVPVRRLGNPYFDDVREELVAVVPDPTRPPFVLYVCEPTREQALRQFGDPHYFGYTEDEALAFFLAHRNQLGLASHPVVLRPHPAEPEGKYDWALTHTGVLIQRDRRLIEEIVACHAVAGAESMAMVIALLAGKRVISTIPPGGHRCSLPFPEVETLSDRI